MKKTTYMIFALCLLSSCYLSDKSTNSYINNVPNVNMFEEVGDYQVSGQYGNNHKEMQIGCAVSPHLSLLGSVYQGVANQQSIEIATGYWNAINPDRTSFIEINAGYGEASIISEGHDVRDVYSFTYSEINRDIRYNRYFIQPTIYNIIPHTNMKWGVGVRFSRLEFERYKYQVVHYSGLRYADQDESNIHAQAIEPYIMVSTNRKGMIDYNLQIVYASRRSTSVDLWRHGGYDPLKVYINTGIRINMHKILEL